MIVADRLIRSRYPNLKPTITGNGMQAIKLLKEKANKGSDLPLFILLDLLMPLMDGFDFLEIYERDFHKNAAAPNVIVLTSSLHDIDKTKALRYKCVKAYMIKPFNIGEFLGVRI